MPDIVDVEKLALDLPEKQRAMLAAHLLSSLAPILQDDDEGVREALRRDADFDADPAFGLSPAEFDRQIQSRRR